jgi:15-cis-phytoene synthase/lycopene beta-cyclase
MRRVVTYLEQWLTWIRSLAYQLILELPLSNTLLPVTLPTVYLWIVDTLALKRGTWVIESGTKLNWHLWDGLEIEEAVFFLVTNVLIVFGLVAFDNAYAILQTFPDLFPTIPELPSPVLLVRALLASTDAYDDDRILGLQEALARLRAKSRSFYLASGVFQGRLRADMILLYSFCRVADDLVDEAASAQEARHWIAKLNQYLDISYEKTTKLKPKQMADFVNSTFPLSAQHTLHLLPTSYLSPQPFYDLMKGFETDLYFSSSSNPFPITDESTLQTYGSRVAGTVAESCLELVFHHTKAIVPESQRKRIVQAGGRMGIALQYVNIARDISVDASNGRVYLPTAWLKEVGLCPEDVIKNPVSSEAEKLRQRLLDSAFRIYDEAKGAIEELPAEARGSMRVAVESYVEIGRVLRKPGYKVKAGRATVSKLRRIRVAWNALNKS